jgi:hypothetical protein
VEEERGNDEYQLFAYIDFNSVEMEAALPVAAQDKRRRYLTKEDRLKLDREP